MIAKIEGLLPKDYYYRTQRELLLIAIDEFKNRFKDYELIITRFEKKHGELTLPVTIKFYLDNYARLLKTLGYCNQ
ncbi:MAG: hypothetical protein N3A59_07060 [Thermodesulfovibrionales bacterium]|nr:hypothetical protein [Thermodesulfovibrionales bacterium]